MKISASPFEPPSAIKPLDTSEQAEASVQRAAGESDANVSAPAAIADVRTGLDPSTKHALSRLGDLIRAQKQKDAQAEAAEIEAAKEPEKTPAGFVIGIGSLAIARANRRIREAQRKRGQNTYQALVREKAISDVQQALYDAERQEQGENIEAFVAELLVDKAG